MRDEIRVNNMVAKDTERRVTYSQPLQEVLVSDRSSTYTAGLSVVKAALPDMRSGPQRTPASTRPTFVQSDGDPANTHQGAGEAERERREERYGKHLRVHEDVQCEHKTACGGR